VEKLTLWGGKETRRGGVDMGGGLTISKSGMGEEGGGG